MAATTHKQTWIKVNTHVDGGIADLIVALNAFPQLQTIESCEGDASRGARVCFRYGEDHPTQWLDLANFVLGYFGPSLAIEIGDLATTSITVTSYGSSHAELAIRPGAVAKATKAVRKLALTFTFRTARRDEELFSFPLK